MIRKIILLMILFLSSPGFNVAAQVSTLSEESNEQIPDSCKPVVPADTTFFPVQKPDPGVFAEPEIMPVFPGGDKAVMDFVIANAIYPETAVTDSVSGRVVLSFVVGRGGCPTKIRIIKSVREDLDNESIRVIKMLPKFIPGSTVRESPKGLYRTTVDVWYMVQFNYRLKKDTASNTFEILPGKRLKN